MLKADLADDFDHVVGLVGLVGDDGVEGGVGSGWIVCGWLAGWVVEVVGRDEADELPDGGEALLVVVGHEVGYAGDLVVGDGSAEFGLGDVFVGDGLDDVGAGDEHVAGALGHEGEVGDGGGVDGSSGAGAEDGGDLRDDAAGEGVAEEDVGVAGEGDDTLLDAGSAGVVEADDGGADAEGGVHDLDDLGGVGLGERAAEDGEVLGEDEDDAAVDAAVAGDEAVAGDALGFHSKISCPVSHKLVGLLEGALVEEEVDALTGGELAGGTLAGAALGASALFGDGVAGG